MDHDDPDLTVVHDEQLQPPQQSGGAADGTTSPPAAVGGNGDNGGAPNATADDADGTADGKLIVADLETGQAHNTRLVYNRSDQASSRHAPPGGACRDEARFSVRSLVTELERRPHLQMPTPPKRAKNGH